MSQQQQYKQASDRVLISRGKKRGSRIGVRKGSSLSHLLNLREKCELPSD